MGPGAKNVDRGPAVRPAQISSPTGQCTWGRLTNQVNHPRGFGASPAPHRTGSTGRATLGNHGSTGRDNPRAPWYCRSTGRDNPRVPWYRGSTGRHLRAGELQVNWAIDRLGRPHGAPEHTVIIVIPGRPAGWPEGPRLGRDPGRWRHRTGPFSRRARWVRRRRHQDDAPRPKPRAPPDEVNWLGGQLVEISRGFPSDYGSTGRDTRGESHHYIQTRLENAREFGDVQVNWSTDPETPRTGGEAGPAYQQERQSGTCPKALTSLTRGPKPGGMPEIPRQLSK